VRHLIAALPLLLIAVLAHATPDAPISAAPGPVPLVIQQTFTLGGPGGWDYLNIDPQAHRLFISRADRVLVMNTLDGSLVKTIQGTQGVHGIALAPELGLGFTSNGRSNTVTVFDLQSLETGNVISLPGRNPDAILYDRASKHVFTFNGASRDISVIDPIHGTVVATIAVGGKPEFAASDEAGRIFVNIEDTAQIAVIDSRAFRSVATWSLPNCEEPTGLALDRRQRRLFSVCRNHVLVVTDADSGKSVAALPIGAGPDAAAFDPERALLFSSNGQDGTVTVIRQDDPDHYTVLADAPTQNGARTMALDADNRRVYLVTADFGPTPQPIAGQPRQRPAVIEGSFRVLVFGY
jgi:YVTN family beta-propeller protein